MTIHARGDVAVAKTGDCVTVLISGDARMGRSLRRTVAEIIEEVGESLPEEDRQRFLDLHAALNLALGEARPRDKKRAQLRAVCMVPDCGCSSDAHA